MKRIQFEGQTHTFPDDFTDADIASALGGSKSASAAPPKPLDTTGRLKAALVPSPQDEELGKNTAVSRALFGDTIGSWDTPGRVVRAVGDAVLPSTNAQAGAMAGTMAAGPLVAAGRAAAVPGMAALSRWPALGRILGATTGGGAGGALEEGPQGALEGATRGAVTATSGEGLGKLANVALKSLPGAKGAIAADDAAAYGREMGRQSPPLAGAQTAEDLRAMAAGPGQRALGQAKGAANAAIEQQLGVQNTLSIPSVSQTPITLQQANDALSEIGARAFSKNPLERTFNGVDQRQLYGQINNELRQALYARDPSGGLARAFDAAQESYRGGLAFLRPLQKPRAFRTGSDLEFNTPTFQRLLADPKFEAAMRGKLGNAGFEALRRAMRVETPGQVDVLAPGAGDTLGSMAQAGGEILRGKGGATQIPALLPRTLLPNLGSSYAGELPVATWNRYLGRTIPPALQQVLDLAAERGSESVGR